MTVLTTPLSSQTALFDQILTNTFSTMSLHVLTAPSRAETGCTVEPLENVLKDGKGASTSRQAGTLIQEIEGTFRRTEAKGDDRIVLGNGWWSERPDTPINNSHAASLFHRKGQITFNRDLHSYSYGMTVKADFPNGSLSIAADLPTDSNTSAMKVSYGFKFGKKGSRSLINWTPGYEVHLWFWKGLGLPLSEAKLVLGPCYSRPESYDGDEDEGECKVLRDHFEYVRILQNRWSNQESIEFRETIQIDCADPYTPDGNRWNMVKAGIVGISILADATLDSKQESHLRRHPLLLGLWEYVTGSE